MQIKHRFRVNASAWKLFRTVFLIGICFLILYPIMVLITTSFKSAKDLIDPTVVFLARNFTFDNIITVFNSINYPGVFLNTIMFVSINSLVQMLSCAFIGYGLARFRFRGNNLVFALSVCTLVIPPQVILLPLYLKFRFFNVLELFKFGGTLTGISLIDTPWPFFLMSLFAVAYKNGLFIFLLRQHFRGIPFVLEEAAYIDGSGVFRTFTKIMLPGAGPMLLTTFLFSFVWQWTDFYYSSLLVPGMKTLNMQLLRVSFDKISAIFGNMSTSVLQAPRFILLITPLVILYLILQKHFTESIIKSGIVG